MNKELAVYEDGSLSTASNAATNDPIRSARLKRGEGRNPQKLARLEELAAIYVSIRSF